MSRPAGMILSMWAVLLISSDRHFPVSLERNTESASLTIVLEHRSVADRKVSKRCDARSMTRWPNP